MLYIKQKKKIVACKLDFITSVPYNSFPKPIKKPGKFDLFFFIKFIVYVFSLVFGVYMRNLLIMEMDAINNNKKKTIKLLLPTHKMPLLDPACNQLSFTGNRIHITRKSEWSDNEIKKNHNNAGHKKNIKGLQENIAKLGVDIIFRNARYNLPSRKSRTIAWYHLCGSKICSQP